MSAVEAAPGVNPELPAPTQDHHKAAELAEQLRRSLAATAQAEQALGRLVSLLV